MMINEFIKRTWKSKLLYQKMGIYLKELKENFNCSKIIDRANLYAGNKENSEKAFDGNNQLISIFVASIKTSENNNSKIKTY